MQRSDWSGALDKGTVIHCFKTRMWCKSNETLQSCRVNIASMIVTMTTTAAVSFGVLGNQDVTCWSHVTGATLASSPALCMSLWTLLGDSGQSDAESSVSAVSGHPGEHRAAGRENEVRKHWLPEAVATQTWEMLGSLFINIFLVWTEINTSSHSTHVYPNHSVQVQPLSGGTASFPSQWDKDLNFRPQM